MYGIFIKEFKSIYRQISKSNKIIQICAALLLIFLIHHFFDFSSLAFTFRRLSSIHYGREGLAGQPKTLVYYHMQGCPYCKKFDPNWEKFKSINNTSIKTRKVDSKDSECQKNGVKGFPSILLTDSNKNKIEECPTRDPDGMLAFCKKNE